jgi:hypothetical protein
VSPLLFLYNHQLHLWKNTEITQIIEKFLPDGEMKVKEEGLEQNAATICNATGKRIQGRL